MGGGKKTRSSGRGGLDQLVIVPDKSKKTENWNERRRRPPNAKFHIRGEKAWVKKSGIDTKAINLEFLNEGKKWGRLQLSEDR